MKKLILVRHAKSSWENNLSDHDRPLNDRGIADAILVSNHIKESDFSADLVLSSDAVRAKTTAKIFVENLQIEASIFHLENDLYDFSGSQLLHLIKNCDNSINTLMIFGHNHAVTAFVNTFGDIPIDNVPTCGVVSIVFDIDNWENIAKGETVSTLFPRDLKNNDSL